MEKSKRSGPIITAQTGWDEAFLIGTESELLEFAEDIIKAVESAKPDEFFGEKTKVSEISGLDGTHSEVKFDWLVVTENQEQNKKLAEKIYGEADLSNL